ncbi:MAG: preprotein translocase subunit YajC [Thermodesulfobacteriota bacterium]|nr:preprotein translocase subunit YajC [Thermodesulfobacteriota bacterium]
MEAFAQNAGGGSAGSTFINFIPLILIFLIFYFLLILPQQKKTKQHQAMLNSLKKGDQVITSGGIHGKIVGLTDTILTLEIADKVKIKVYRTYIAGKSELK